MQYAIWSSNNANQTIFSLAIARNSAILTYKNKVLELTCSSETVCNWQEMNDKKMSSKHNFHLFLAVPSKMLNKC